MLNLFPAGFEATLLVAVLFGTCFTVLMNEWLGWDFVGVVVPGYLAALLTLEPPVVAVVATEGVLTWVAARALDRLLVRARVIHPVFGRDRFFLILVTSLLVRVSLEGFVLPGALDLAAAVHMRVAGDAWPALERWRGELFGIGVVLAPLVANRFWRPGLRSGLVQLSLETLVVFAMLLALGHVTNFSLASFALTFDDRALQFLNAPAVQLTLLLGAALASGLNRRYGWDYHGILVPALLALAVVTPLKLVTTLVEAGTIVVIVRLLLRLPRLRHANVEGARKIALCLLIGFVLKLALAHGLARFYPGYRATDFFGFGYLLPCLLAERLWTRGRVALIVLPTLQVSVVAAVASALLALGLTYLRPTPVAADTDDAPELYATVSQALAAGATRARCDDGYEVRSRPDGVLVAQRSGVPADRARVLTFTAASFDDTVAAAAARGEALVMAADVERGRKVARELGTVDEDPPAPLRAAVRNDPRAARALLLAAASGAIESDAQGAASARDEGPALTEARRLGWPARALDEAARRLQPLLRAGAGPDGAPDGKVLDAAARRLAPLGLQVWRLPATPGVPGLLVTGPGWPAVAFGNAVGTPAAPAPVIAAPHPTEQHTPAAAWLAGAVTGGSVVAGEGAARLALALAEPSARPLLIVRGAAPPAEADAVLVAEPQPPQGRPGWLAPFLDVLAEAGLRVRGNLRPNEAALRTFPPTAGKVAPAALLWLAPQARRTLAGMEAEVPARPDWLALAAARGVPIVRTDAALWLSEAHTAPPPATLAQIERLARSEDVALLRPMAGLTVLVDDRHGVLGFAAHTADGGRALALVGLRDERRIATAGVDATSATLVRTRARTLVADRKP